MPLSGQTMSVTNTYTPGAVITASGFNTNFTDFATSLTTIATAFQGDMDANGYDILFDNGTGFYDDSGNEQLLFGKTGSAVNYAKLTNAATGGNPTLAALGDDSNISLVLKGKGTGNPRADDPNGNELLTFTTTASAVNEINITNAATGNAPVLAATGGDTNIILRLNGKGTGGVEIEGTATNDSATAGYVGEFQSSVVALGSAVALSSGTAKTITSLSLTAGDWDVSANVNFLPNGSTTVGMIEGSVSLTDNTIEGSGGLTLLQATLTTGAAQSICSGPRRISIAATTTVYMVAASNFGVSTMAAYGMLSARRVR